MQEYAITFRKSRDDKGVSTGRVVGYAQCGECPFVAEMTDDTQDEVDVFLSQRLVDHAVRHHPRPEDQQGGETDGATNSTPHDRRDQKPRG